jgi:hypothetical protein
MSNPAEISQILVFECGAEPARSNLAGPRQMSLITVFWQGFLTADFYRQKKAKEKSIAE